MHNDERSPAPLYARVRDAILGRIVSGELRAGAMLPSEFDLGAEFGVSQGTARKALSELEQRGVLQRRQGRGTFVAVTTPERALFHFFRLREMDGSSAVPALINETVRKRRSTAAERAAYGQDVASVYQIDRVRSLSGTPGVAETMSVPAALFPGFAERSPLPNTLYAFYQSAYGIAVVCAREALTAIAASPEDAEALGIAAGTPLLEVRRRAIDIAGRTVELRQSRYLTDGRYYDVELR